MDAPVPVTRVVQRDTRLATWIKALSGPAISAMLIASVLLAADWVPLLGRLGVWTTLTEETRAKGVVAVAIILAFCVGVVLWVAHVGRPSKTEITAPGGASLKIEQPNDE